MNRIYAGIGSRQTPPAVLEEMTELAELLSYAGYVLRSGGADGADLAFERGALPYLKEIYLPWPGFNQAGLDKVPGLVRRSPRDFICLQALELAAQFHPNWDRLSLGVRKLMARNCYQILGYDLMTPCSFVVCWTPGGEVVGGTGQALRVAHHYNIKVFNMATEALTAKELFTKIVS